MNKKKVLNILRFPTNLVEAEGEVTIVKAVGMNSPEMKALQKEVEELKAELARAKEDHQYDNLVHQKELESLGKK